MAWTRIEWTECTWNPVTGCTEVSEGCRHCYARGMAHRLQAMGQPRYREGFAVTAHPELLDVPRGWARPRMVFVNSMGDLFHDAVSDEFIGRVFGVIADTQRHTFQVLTKRSRRLRELAGTLQFPRNLWVGVTVEAQKHTDRIHDLLATGAVVKFVSFEPLLGPLGRLPLRGVDWAIVGGESGPGARPMDAEWVRTLRDQCVRRSIPFFFKQWGGRGGVNGGGSWRVGPGTNFRESRLCPLLGRIATGDFDKARKVACVHRPIDREETGRTDLRKAATMADRSTPRPRILRPSRPSSQAGKK